MSANTFAELLDAPRTEIQFAERVAIFDTKSRLTYLDQSAADVAIERAYRLLIQTC